MYRNKIPQWNSVLVTLKMRRYDSTKLNIHCECFSEKFPQIFKKLIERMFLNKCLCKYSKDHELSRTPVGLKLRWNWKTYVSLHFPFRLFRLQLLLAYIFPNTFKVNVLHHTKTSQLIYNENQLTGLYMIRNFGLKYVKI